MTVVLTATASTGEDGGSITYTASLEDGAGNAVTTANAITVNLQNGETITIAANASSGDTAVAVNRDDVYLENDAISNAITSVSEANAGSAGAFEDLAFDGTAVSTTITDDSDAVTVTLTSSDVEAGENITITASVGVNAPETDLVLTLQDADGRQQTITIPEGDTSASVSFVSPDVDDGETLRYTIVSAVGGNYENLDTSDTVDVLVFDASDATVTTTDDDTADFGTDTATGTLNFENVSSVVFSYDGGLGDLADGSPSSAAGVTTFVAADGSWQLTINESTGGFTFTQTDVYSHATDEDSASATISVNLNGEDSPSATLTLNITDAGVTANPDTASIQEGGVETVAGSSNVVLVLDNSTSMTNNNNENLNALKAAVEDLFASGNVNAVQIVFFGTNATALPGEDGLDGWYTDLDAALAAIESALGDGGTGDDGSTRFTNYGDALSVTASNFTPPPSEADSLITVFLTDGQPTRPGFLGIFPEDDPLTAQEESDWIEFLNENDVDASYVVGFGSGFGDNTGNVEPIAALPTEGTFATGTAGDSDAILIASNLDNLGDELLQLVEQPIETVTVNGNVLTNDEGNDTPLSVVNATITSGSFADYENAGLEASFDTELVIDGSSTGEVEVLNADGDVFGTVTLNSDGSYTFDLVPGMSTDEDVHVVITYTALDADGDTSQSTLRLTATNEESVLTPTLTVNLASGTQGDSQAVDQAFTATVGDQAGDDVIQGSDNVDYNEQEVITLDFGAAFAGQQVTVELDINVSGTWNYDGAGGSDFDDYWEIRVDGEAVTRFFYNGAASGAGEVTDDSDNLLTGAGTQNIRFADPNSGNSGDLNFDQTEQVTVTLDENGQAVIGFAAATTQTSEFVTINGATVVGLDEFTYEIAVDASISGTDATSLSVTIDGVPSDGTFRSLTAPAGFTLTDNGNGNYTLVADDGGDIDTQLTLVVAVPDGAEPDFDLNITATGTDGTDQAQTNNILSISGTTSAPVAIDLDGDGVEYLSQVSGVVFTDESSGESASTAWVAPDDGLLVIDANNSGTVDSSSEYVFTEWSDSAQTDLEAIAEVFDTNQDGVLDAQDERFDEFAVWQDADSDGVTDEGELSSLTDLGIESIELTYREDSEERVDGEGDVTVFGQANVNYEDGSTTTAEDVSFAVEAADLLSEEDDLTELLSDESASEGGEATGPSRADAAAIDIAQLELTLNFDHNESDSFDQHE